MKRMYISGQELMNELGFTYFDLKSSVDKRLLTPVNPKNGKVLSRSSIINSPSSECNLEDAVYPTSELSRTFKLLELLCIDGEIAEREFNLNEKPVAISKEFIAELHARGISYDVLMDMIDNFHGVPMNNLELEHAPRQIRTIPACKASIDSSTRKWKEYAQVMVKTAVDCMKDGPRERTRPELENMAKRHGELNGVALDLLRGCLPDGHVRKDGGPTRQG